MHWPPVLKFERKSRCARNLKIWLDIVLGINPSQIFETHLTFQVRGKLVENQNNFSVTGQSDGEGVLFKQ